MRVAVFGDIHGNLFALQAVLADLRRERPDALVVFGDMVYKMPWGAEVVDLLRSLPCHPLLGNAELYLLLWGTPLWPAHWSAALACELVAWEQARMGAARLAWLAGLPEHVSFSGGRLDDLLIVHGVPGDPFVPFLARPGEDRAPWVQTDGRVQALLHGVEADVVLCGHTHAPLQRTVAGANGALRLINPGSLSYSRGPEKAIGRAYYALADWSAPHGWQVTRKGVLYDPAPLHRALLAQRGDYPLAGYIANRMRPPGAPPVPATQPDLTLARWGDAPLWWAERDALPAWRAVRGEDTER